MNPPGQRKRCAKMKILIVFGCAAIYGFVVTVLAYAGIPLGGIPTILLGVVLFATIKLLTKKWDEKKASKERDASKHMPQTIQPHQKTSQEEATVERWYTCPECGSLVREGEICDCVAKRKEEDAAKRAEEATVNELPSVWAYRWLNSQRAIGAITEEQYTKMGDTVASWDVPQTSSKTGKYSRRAAVLLGSMCILLAIISLALGIVLSKTYTKNIELKASISVLEADYNELEVDFEKTEESYNDLKQASKRQTEIIAQRDAKISELENGFNPEYEKWGEGIYNGTICVLLKSEGMQDALICHRANCVTIENVPFAERMYFPSKLDARAFCVQNSFLPVICSECNPTN